MGLKNLWLKSLGLKCHLSGWLKDISSLVFSTMNFSTPRFKNSWLKSPGLISAWLKSLGLRGPGLKLGVEKFVVEMSFNQIPDTCPGRLQHILKKCWHYEPENRNNFQEIVEILESPYENAQEFENSSYMDPTFDDYETPNTIPNCYIDVDVRNTVWIKPRSDKNLP